MSSVLGVIATTEIASARSEATPVVALLPEGAIQFGERDAFARRGLGEEPFEVIIGSVHPSRLSCSPEMDVNGDRGQS